MFLIDFLELAVLLRLSDDVFKFRFKVLLYFRELQFARVLDVFNQPPVCHERSWRLRVSLQLAHLLHRLPIGRAVIIKN